MHSACVRVTRETSLSVTTTSGRLIDAISLLRYTERFREKKIDTLKVDSANLIANKKKFNKCTSNLERLLHRFREWNSQLKT